MVHSHTHTYSYTKSFVFRHSWSLTRRLEKLDLIILTEIVTVCIEWRLLRLKNMGSVKIVHTCLKVYRNKLDCFSIRQFKFYAYVCTTWMVPTYITICN